VVMVDTGLLCINCASRKKGQKQGRKQRTGQAPGYHLMAVSVVVQLARTIFQVGPQLSPLPPTWGGRCGWYQRHRCYNCYESREVVL
jgi:hypothetical protein